MDLATRIGTSPYTCLACSKSFMPKDGEEEFSQELFGIRGAECPHCGSFNEASSRGLS
jgi:DNA-directed RNA polymerase subunit RPC12/RpoP